MNKSIALQNYVIQQLDTFFPTVEGKTKLNVKSFNIGLHAVSNSISKVLAYRGTEFDYLNSGQYATFLYYLSHYVWMNDSDKVTATRIFLLNKALHGIDLFYEVKMPKYFLVGHSSGIVFTKARYGEYCVFHQGCTVGRNFEDRPIIGNFTIMYPNSSVIGKCKIGDNTIITPGVQIINRNIPGNCIVFPGSDGDLKLKKIEKIMAKKYFDI